MPDRRRWPYVAVIAALVVAMPLQREVTQRKGEPYPALLFPSFEGTPRSVDRSVVSLVEITVALRGGTTEQVTPEQLLPSTGLNPDAILQLGLFGPVAQPEAAALRRWLGGVVRELFPRRTPTAVRFDLVARTISIPEREVVAERVQASVTVDLP